MHRQNNMFTAFWSLTERQKIREMKACMLLPTGWLSESIINVAQSFIKAAIVHAEVYRIDDAHLTRKSICQAHAWICVHFCQAFGICNKKIIAWCVDLLHVLCACYMVVCVLLQLCVICAHVIIHVGTCWALGNFVHNGHMEMDVFNSLSRPTLKEALERQFVALRPPKMMSFMFGIYFKLLLFVISYTPLHACMNCSTDDRVAYLTVAFAAACDCWRWLHPCRPIHVTKS